MRTALGERTPTCVIVPKDLQEAAAVEAPPHEHDTVHSSAGFSPPRVVPERRRAEARRRRPQRGQAGGDARRRRRRGAADEILLSQDLLGAGVAKALLGRAVLPDALPFVTGSIGLLGTKPSWDLMNGCDTLLMVGSNFMYSEFLPKEGHARGVQIDIDPRLVGLRYPFEVNLVGDARLTLGALIPFLAAQDRSRLGARRSSAASPTGGSSWRTALTSRRSRSTRSASSGSSRRASPIGVILTSDSGSAANWFARDLMLRNDMMASISGSLATMGCGVPYAIGAKFAHPDRPAIALVGDGAMQMNGNAELLTIKRYWQRWRDPRLVILVLHNNDLNQVTWEMRAMAGDSATPPRRICRTSTTRATPSSAACAAIKVDHPDQVGPAWDEALEVGSAVPARRRSSIPTSRPSRRTSRSRRRRRSASACSRGSPARGGSSSRR